MTAPTSRKLAEALRSAGFEDLARRAAGDEFHDFLSPHDVPDHVLNHELVNLCSDGSLTAAQRIAANNLRARFLNGEFDANEAESEAWARSGEGRDAFRRLVEGK